MVLWIVDRFSNLSLRHYLVIVVTIVVPVVFPTFMDYFVIECLWIRVAIDVGVILIWALFVVIVVARLVERDTGEVNQLVSERVVPLEDDLERQREEHGSLMADMQRQVEGLESRIRSALEPLGVDLPLGAIDLRVTARVGAPTISIGVSVSGGSRWARIRAWFRHALRRAWVVIWGKRRSS